MAGKIFLEMLPKRCLFPGAGINLWGRFSRYSYSTAQRVEVTSKVKPPFTDIECEAHNSKIPTYKQIKNNPELQDRLAEMYKQQAQDPDFHQLTIESMKLGVRSLGKETP